MNKRTKLILIAVAAVAVIAVAVWLIFFQGGENKADLTFATEGNWKPYTYHDETTNELKGFDVEVAQAIAKKLGMEAKFEEVEFSAILAGIESKRYTTGANFFDVTEDRAKNYTFTEPYAYGSTVLVVRADNEDIKSFEDLAGKTTANSPNSSYMALGEKYGATVTGIESLPDTMNMVETGRVQATINASDAFLDYMQAKPDAPLKIVAQLEEKTPVAFPFPKEGTEELVEKFNKAIEELRADGTLAAISVKYFGYDITQP
ncbi:MAG: transporter substrate-binding domain-containing protein [Clostridia bacterium]|nr:transporter substrate-binding domain-containing protein [Clostridia bacterium]